MPIKILFRLFGFLLIHLIVTGAAVSANRLELDKYKRPLTIPFDGVKAYSIQLATLGKMLFFDPRLSGAKNMSCATCHNPSFGYEAPVDFAIGAANLPVERHTPTILNMAWVSSYFWDGRASSLEKQAEGPISSAVEMNGKFETIIADLKTIPGYAAWFSAVFPGEGITKANILTSIATYERTIVSGWSPFDRWVDGNESAISLGAKRGFALFTGKAGCSKCHTGWNFTDNKFHDTGLNSSNIGRARHDPSNLMAMHAFKTPGLRNTMYRAPYMHNGAIATIQKVIEHYETGGLTRESLSKDMIKFTLSRSERNDLVAFIKTLTAEKQEASLPILPN